MSRTTASSRSVQVRLFAAVASALTLGLLLGCAAPVPAPPPPVGQQAALSTESLAGVWAGEGTPAKGLPRRWVMLRKPDGRFELQLTYFRSPHEAKKSVETGSWFLRDGLLLFSTDGETGPPTAYKTSKQALGCLLLQMVDARTGLPGAIEYSFMECPYPNRVPPDSTLHCKASFTVAERGISEVLDIRIALGADGRRTAWRDGLISNEDADVWDYPVRSQFDPASDPASDPPAAMNPGEAALQHLYALASHPDLGLKIDVPFRYADVRMVRIHELEPGSRFNPFGGAVLFEAYDAQGRSLGKMLRALLVAPCMPVAG